MPLLMLFSLIAHCRHAYDVAWYAFIIAISFSIIIFIIFIIFAADTYIIIDADFITPLILFRLLIT